MKAVTTALTIAGSDSSGGAGIQADLKTFAAFGLYGTCAITAITAQNTTGVVESFPLSADLVTAQIEAVAGDVPPKATKIGMLANAAIVEAVAAAIEALDLPLVVVDPVMLSTSGARLLDDDGLQMLRAELLPRCTATTPNIPEAEALSGRVIASIEDARAAARQIYETGGAAVIIKGGHATGNQIVDLLYDGNVFTEIQTTRINTPHTHGTGCTFASAVAANLALGRSLTDSMVHAQEYVAGAIQHAFEIGHGHGPLDHFWKIRSG
ncbi:MAG: bifunctional hydroxymethylpyrimidine kinase/phosphomethylpyrimidine kinase [Blastocatellia bacterium]|nr:MAG: bifunctional hydroxymethylpyrimidine kinase/phosphomethylpyrimidine kinase [Blastocatellia bacterium]